MVMKKYDAKLEVTDEKNQNAIEVKARCKNKKIDQFTRERERRSQRLNEEDTTVY